jgi:hypothetical protein
MTYLAAHGQVLGGLDALVVRVCLANHGVLMRTNIE